MLLGRTSCLSTDTAPGCNINFPIFRKTQSFSLDHEASEMCTTTTTQDRFHIVL